MGESEEYDLDDLVRRARDMMVPGSRTILGITGAPGSGKSTVASDVVSRLGDDACLAPMDGFHLAGSLLTELGRTDRKGAPDTFDSAGYARALERLRRAEPVVLPEFRRDIEDAIAGSLPIPAHVPLVVTEGNYLLLDGPGEWQSARAAIDTVWHLELDAGERHRRLVDRHMRYGKSARAAREWTFGSDEANASLVEAAAWKADLIVRMPV